ncbi:MAG TPA: alpha/beta hydrolase family protein [Pyrinomonadaceae bacterium]|nr:alpha/beta hydrolase family protein [Pyrinomonadaceae bacterium]
MLGRIIRAQERRMATRDTNRVVRPFEWGTHFVSPGANGEDPREFFRRHTDEVLRRSENFFALPHVTDYKLDGDLLTWTSAVETPTPENNTARARLFPAAVKEARRGEASSRPRRAVLVIPQWNAEAHGHVNLCRALARLGVASLRLTLPYHEERRPAELERADYLVSSNVGRTLQSVRQAVLDARAAARWLKSEGYERLGIVGTSIGSCVAFLALTHDASINVGVFNHVSGYVADVVWRGISTRHVREGFGDALTLEELRRHWLPISPLAFAARLLDDSPPRPLRFIAARHDLTFPPDLSREMIDEMRRLGVAVDAAWLPCGHYTAGELPWVYLDGWKIVSFLRKHL